MSKSVNHWYPRYPADYAKKTRHLSLLQHGVYALLMDYCYSTGKPLPANAVQLHRICMAFDEAEQVACMEVVREFFELRDDGWHNARIDEELLKRSAISEKRSMAASSRYAKAPAKAPANAPANADTSTSTSTVEEEREAKASPKKKSPTGSRLSADWVLPQEWGEYALDKGFSRDEIFIEAELFKNYWIAKSGAAATKMDWRATWQNWILSAFKRKGERNGKFGNSQSGSPHGRGHGVDPALDQIARIARLGEA